MDSLIISIVTVTFNAEKTLEKSIKSVIEQDTNIFEYIIIDGHSTDRTVDIIRKYNDYISYWISEKDRGIYDAMNKAIDVAKGKWIYFLGADDIINPGTLEYISNYLNFSLSAVYGDIIYDTGDIMHSTLGIGTLIQNTLHHQGTFYNKKLFETFRYDTKYKVISDYELNLQMYLRNDAVLYVPILVATCGSSGTSSILSTIEVNHLRGKYIKNKSINYILNSMLKFYYFYFTSKKSLKEYLKKLTTEH